ncbi:MAG: porin family protein [Alistipes sp.]
MMKLKWILFVCVVIACSHTASAQHTFGVTMGYGMGSASFEPKQEGKSVWGLSSGVSWRYYTAQRFVGSFGIDLELLQQGFSSAPYASTTENPADYLYYTRKQSTLILPIVWQPHVYLFKNRLRVFIEAAATFSYNLGSTYTNEVAKAAGKEDWEGDYEFKMARDNRWGYGLAGGAGFAVLIHRFEVQFRARYYFGFGDLLRNRNKYADNKIDGSENPFWATPLRSPLNNINFSVGVSYRFNKKGFDEWTAPRKKRDKANKTFDYKEGTKGTK